MKYNELPLNGRKAIKQYMETEGNALVTDREYEFKNVPVENLLQQLIEEYGEDSVQNMAKRIKQGDPQEYSENWAVILGDGIIEDGWHRFFTYVKQGKKQIPTVRIL